MHVTIVMKIMERCGVSVTKSVHVVIGRSLTPKSCFKRVFYVFHTNFTHSPCTAHVSENTYTCTTHFVMFAKINFFYVPNILILSRLTNLRVFTNILYDSKERNIINNPHLSVWLNFFVYQWRGLLAAGWNITHRSGNYSSSPTCKHGMTYISPIALQSWRLRHQPGQVRWYTAIYYSTRQLGSTGVSPCPPAFSRSTQFPLYLWRY